MRSNKIKGIPDLGTSTATDQPELRHDRSAHVPRLPTNGGFRRHLTSYACRSTWMRMCWSGGVSTDPEGAPNRRSFEPRLGGATAIGRGRNTASVGTNHYTTACLVSNPTDVPCHGPNRQIPRYSQEAVKTGAEAPRERGSRSYSLVHGVDVRPAGARWVLADFDPATTLVVPAEVHATTLRTRIGVLAGCFIFKFDLGHICTLTPVQLTACHIWREASPRSQFDKSPVDGRSSSYHQGRGSALAKPLQGRVLPSGLDREPNDLIDEMIDLVVLVKVNLELLGYGLVGSLPIPTQR
jgi:hypothetical protein